MHTKFVDDAVCLNTESYFIDLLLQMVYLEKIKQEQTGIAANMVLDQSQPFETGDLTSDDSKLHASKAEEMSSSDSTNISPVRTQFGDTYQNHSTTRTILLLASVFASSFLVGLDRNVLATVSHLSEFDLTKKHSSHVLINIL